MQHRRSTHRGSCLSAPFRPQGLVTLSAACSLRSLASFVSRRQRSWEVPFGVFSSQKVPDMFPFGRTHIPFSPAVSPPQLSAGPARWVAVPELWPSRESLTAGRMFSAPTAGYSHGVCPSRVLSQQPCPDFAGTPLACLAISRSLDHAWPATQSIDRLLPGSIREATIKLASGQNNPLKVSAPTSP
jgi:hypothetical protein